VPTGEGELEPLPEGDGGELPLVVNVADTETVADKDELGDGDGEEEEEIVEAALPLLVADWQPLGLGVGEPLREGVPSGEGELELLPEGDGGELALAVSVADTETVAEEDELGDGKGEDEGETVEAALPLPVADVLPLGDAEALPEALARLDCVWLGDTDGDGLPVGERVPLAEMEPCGFEVRGGEQRVVSTGAAQHGRLCVL